MKPKFIAAMAMTPWFFDACLPHRFITGQTATYKYFTSLHWVREAKKNLEVKPPFLMSVGLRSTIILVGVYHHPKGTTIFKMVVDFQGTVFSNSAQNPIICRFFC